MLVPLILLCAVSCVSVHRAAPEAVADVDSEITRALSVPTSQWLMTRDQLLLDWEQTLVAINDLRTIDSESVRIRDIVSTSLMVHLNAEALATRYPRINLVFAAEMRSRVEWVRQFAQKCPGKVLRGSVGAAPPWVEPSAPELTDEGRVMLALARDAGFSDSAFAEMVSSPCAYVRLHGAWAIAKFGGIVQFRLSYPLMDDRATLVQISVDPTWESVVEVREFVTPPPQMFRKFSDLHPAQVGPPDESERALMTIFSDTCGARTPDIDATLSNARSSGLPLRGFITRYGRVLLWSPGRNASFGDSDDLVRYACGCDDARRRQAPWSVAANGVIFDELPPFDHHTCR